MKLKIAYLLTILLTTGCTSHAGTSKADAGLGDWTLPYPYWYFHAIYPTGLDALATRAYIADTVKHFYIIPAVETGESTRSVGHWSDKIKYSSSERSRYNQPPRYLILCWDSFVDKKTYATGITFSADTWKKMRTRADHPDFMGKPFWYNTLIIGLAPGGKVKIWLKDENFNYPNIPVTPQNIETRAGAEDDFGYCYDDEAKEAIKRGFNYTSEKTEAFIKGKTYPYGDW